MNDNTTTGGINFGRLIAYGAAAVTLCFAMYAGCGGCRNSKSLDQTPQQQIQKMPPEQLEQLVLQLAPVDRARVVKYIADNDLLDEKLAYSAHIYFKESYKRQEDKKVSPWE